MKIAKEPLKITKKYVWRMRIVVASVDRGEGLCEAPLPHTHHISLPCLTPHTTQYIINQVSFDAFLKWKIVYIKSFSANDGHQDNEGPRLT